MPVNILIGAVENLSRESITYRYYLRVRVPADLRSAYEDANAVSVWPNPTQTQIDAVKAGAVLERTGTVTIPNTGTAEGKRTAVQTAVLAQLAALRAELAALTDAPAVGDTYDADAQTWTQRTTAGAG